MTRRLALALGLGLVMALFVALDLPGQPLMAVPTVPADLLPGRACGSGVRFLRTRPGLA